MVALVAVAMSLAVAPDTVPPNGAVGGVTSYAAGTMQLSVQATDAGLGLSRAAATLDGSHAVGARFGDGTCVETPDEAAGTGCPAVGSVTLALPTTGVADGPHRLAVTALDAAGNVAVLEDRTITVANTPPPQHSTVTVTVGSGATTNPPPAGGGNHGGVAGEDEESGCRSPRLSVSLAQPPLRIRGGVPVLAAGRLYRFTGRLTCRIAGHRRSAPRGTRVELRSVVRGHVASTRRLTVGRRGRIAVRLAPRSSRVLVFRVRARSGAVVRVRLPVRVARARAARAALQDPPGTPVGGTVPSYLALSLDESIGFARFPAGPGTYELEVRARVTASDSRARLSVADGDLADGRALGHLASGASVLSQPLEARVGAAAFQGLDAAVDPLLALWREPVASERATVHLRQRIAAGERPRGTYEKTVLITLSPQAP